MNKYGNIFQTYNCGPAAARSALWQLGVQTKEGTLAIHSKTSPIIGTQPDLLSRAINELFRDEGVNSYIQYFDTVEELKGKLPYLAAIQFGFMVDHWVAVLDITETSVRIADPLEGVKNLTPQEFEKNGEKAELFWRKSDRKCMVYTTISKKPR